MALVKPVIFQIVGYQNSGKTTITSKLIQALLHYGLKTATIKHHGHNARPDAPDEKDSAKHLKAGAVASIVEGGGRMILQADHYPASLLEQINLIEHFQAEVILIEGYKLEEFPKLVLLRNKADLELLSKVTNVKMIMCWDEELAEHLKGESKVPIFCIHDETALEMLVQVIMSNAQKMD